VIPASHSLTFPPTLGGVEDVEPFHLQAAICHLSASGKGPNAEQYRYAAPRKVSKRERENKKIEHKFQKEVAARIVNKQWAQAVESKKGSRAKSKQTRGRDSSEIKKFLPLEKSKVQQQWAQY
jgi:hypothetical protein